MSGRIAAVISAAALIPAMIGPAAQAQDVELRSFDGTVELEGNLLAYDGAYYQLETEYGPLTVSAEGVSCAGPGCPDLTSFVAEARIAGAATVAEGLFPELLEAFAVHQGMSLQRDTARNGAERRFGLYLASRRQPARRTLLRGGGNDRRRVSRAP
jgi:phosphate transport system substrate-binding protein